jgi:hypothetical protein
MTQIPFWFSLQIGLASTRLKAFTQNVKMVGTISTRGRAFELMTNKEDHSWSERMVAPKESADIYRAIKTKQWNE